jgi:hypothetical protein
MKKETDTNKQNEPESSEKSTTTQPTQTAVTTPTQHPSSETTTTTTTTTPARGIDELKSETQTNTEIQQITSQSTETNTTDKNNKEGESGKETESELKVTDTTTTSPKDKENKESSTPRSSRQYCIIITLCPNFIFPFSLLFSVLSYSHSLCFFSFFLFLYVHLIDLGKISSLVISILSSLKQSLRPALGTSCSTC